MPVDQPTQDAVRHSPPPADSVFRFEDSLSEQDEFVAPQPLVNFFAHHELPVRHENPLPLNRATPNWIFPVLLAVLGMFTFLRIFYARYFNRLFDAFASSNLANQVVRDENLLIQRASVLLNIVFYMVAALFLYFVSLSQHWELEGLDYGFSRFLFFAILVAAIYSLKLIILKTCGYIFGLDREMAAYIFNIFLVNSMLGMALLPVTGLLAFAAWFPPAWVTALALIIIAAAFIYRLVRGVLIAVASPSFSPVYLILYLCALEFAPLLVVLKLVTPA